MISFQPTKTFRRLVTLGAISAIAAGCGNQTSQTTTSQAIPVKLQTVNAATLVDSSAFVGTLEAKQAVNLAPKINGRILKIYVEPGAAVRQGQPIVQLEPDQQQEEVNAAVGNLNVQRSNLDKSEADLRTSEAQRDAARAELANATANLANSQEVAKTREADLRREQATFNLSEINLKRSKFLVENGVEAQQDLDDKTTAYEDANATVEAARKTLDAARASVRAATAALDQARQNLKAAEQRVSAARATVNSQRAAIAQAEGQLGSINQNLIYNTLAAPIDGFAGNFDRYKVGDYVNIGQVVTTITDNQVFDLNVSIPTENQKRLRIGLPVEIVNPDGSAGTRGKISYLSSLVDPGAQAILVKMTFKNDGTLRNNQYVRARVIWDERPGVLIPTTAVSTLGSQKFVFVAQKGTEKEKAELVARQTPITVGTIQGQSYQVISGVKKGDKIVVSRILDLKDGTPITGESLTSEQTVEQ